MNPKRGRWLIALDRDGTLIEERDYLADPDQVKLLPGVVSGLKRLRRANCALVVITNQSGVARGLMTRRDVERVNRRFQALLRGKGVRLDGLYWCAHGPTDGCICRKPELGLLKEAAADLHVSWRRSVSIGDKFSDVALGRSSGGAGVLVLTGYGLSSLKNGKSTWADFVAKDFLTAADWVLNWCRKHPVR